MPKLRVHNLSISLDGYVAGPDQSLEHPLGVGGLRLHDWLFEGETRREEAAEWIERGEANIGATIMGRNMFGPIRGDWGDSDWSGWWGDDPPYHHPAIVLTHHPHPPIKMQGGTTFFFITDGIEAALERAFAAAAGADVRLGGGAATVQQYLRAGLIDEMHLAIAPILLGQGERLFDNVGNIPAGYEAVEIASSPLAAHVYLARR